ncbi:MAG: TetR/AcrR family transcriptional regulator [Oscillospiraceae bacterium]
MEKEDRRVRLTKRMLKESLLELLHGGADIHKISVRELCERADINRSTFYKYYGSQYDLLKEMEDDWFGQIEQNIGDSTALDSFHLQDVLNYVNENLELSRLLCNSNVDPDFAQRLFSLPSVSRLIQESLPLDNMGYAADYVHECHVNGGYSLIKLWLNKEERESPEEMVEIMKYVFRVKQ